jgi:ankyrin repeat protein
VQYILYIHTHISTQLTAAFVSISYSTVPRTSDIIKIRVVVQNRIELNQSSASQAKPSQANQSINQSISIVIVIVIMELTLTGASLNSGDGTPSGNGTSGNTTTNATTNNNNNTNKNPSQQQPKQQQCGHNHNHGHSHSHSHGHNHNNDEQECCSNNSNPHPSNANFQSVESIPVDKLLSNPPVLFSTLIACMKGGSGAFGTFTYLVDVVLKHEQEKQSPMKWGTDIYDDTDTTRSIGIGDSTNTKTGTGTSINKEFQCKSALGRRAGDGHTLSHWAAKRSDDLRFLQYLTTHVPHISIHAPSTDNVGMTPLHWAATEGSIQMVNLILKLLDNQNGYQHQHQHQHQNTTNTPLTQVLLPQHQHQHPINTRDKSGCTPLLIAAQYGHADLAAFLIKRGADPHAVDDSKDTALHWAAYKGAVPVCGLLIHLNGIRGHLDLIDVFGQSPLHLASLRGNVDVVTYFLEQAEGYECGGLGGSGLGHGGLGHDGHGRDEEDGTNTSAGLTLTRPPTPSPSSSNKSHKTIAAQLLTLTDRDGKTPLDLTIKKKKPHAETILRQAMDKHCTTHQSITQTIVKNAKLFFSCRNWLSWLGLVSENGRPPKFIFWFVAINLALATLYELVMYAHVNVNANLDHGRLWEYTRLHYATIVGFGITWFSFLMVYWTDPGLLATKNYASSNIHSASSNLNIAMSMDGCMEATCTSRARSCYSSLANCLNENKRIKREMHTLTNDLRNLYEETLESYASMDSECDKEKDNKHEHEKNDGCGGDDHLEKLTLCHSCHIARPHRSKHCRVLNRCVLLFDHHCPFVGTTIGLYNYKYFYLFVISFTVTEILFCATGFLYLRNAPDGTGWEYGKLLVVVYFALYTIMSFGLSVYHTQLVRRNLTTNEHQNLFKYKYLKDENGRYRNPFHRGCVGNFMSRFMPGKDAYTLVHEEHARNSNANKNIKMDVEMRRNVAVSDKKNEEKLSLVQNVV